VNEFYWAIMGEGITNNPLDDPAVLWLTKKGELERVSVDHPDVRLFNTEAQATNFIRLFLTTGECRATKIHKDYIFI
jgi:hypothetical protein